MKGFEINYNGDVKKVAVDDGLLTVNLFDNKGDSHIFVETVDYKTHQRSVWYDWQPIKTGDEFRMRFMDISECSSPLFEVEEIEVERPKTKLEFFHELEDKLKKRRLL